MKKSISVHCVLAAVCWFCFVTWGYSITVTTQGITLEVERVLHGQNGGEFYGFSNGKIILPNDKGGQLSFCLYNDMRLDSYSVTNYLNLQVGSMPIKIPHYTTRNHIHATYQEFSGEWGAAGLYHYVIGVPEYVSSITFDNAGSETGIELNLFGFTPGYRQFNNNYLRTKGRRGHGPPLVEAARVLTGAKSGTKFYGYAGGVIHLPHLQGGYLTFDVYNDQNYAKSSTLNVINLNVGGRTRSFKQYTTTMDLTENYVEFPSEWGPAGGSQVIIQVPEDVAKVVFDYGGSQTGIEVAQFDFTKGPPIIFDFKERTNRTKSVLAIFPRELHVPGTNATFYGYSSGHVILPSNKGGTLTFAMYNDHHRDAKETKNRLLVDGGKLGTFHLVTKRVQLHEFYREFPNEFGPAGGKPISIRIPVGVSQVSFSNSGSQTGVELAGFEFHGDPCN